MSTRRLKLVVAYDGTDFCGWAPQAGRRSVQSTLTKAIRRVSSEEVEIVGASRTDAGAHALGQVCHFDTRVAIPAEKWTRALNDVMESDIAVQTAEIVPDAFHARFSARYRHYRYRIVIGTRQPFIDRWSYNDWRELDLDRMREGAAHLLGRHDFRAYTAELQPWITNTVRRILKIEIGARGHEVDIDVQGTAFLRGMMRRMAGALFEVGIGRREPASLAALLDGSKASEEMLPVVLPAKGLTLLRVHYGKRLRDLREETDEEDE